MQRLQQSSTQQLIQQNQLLIYRRSAVGSIYSHRPYRAVKIIHLVYKNQSLYAVSGTSRCLTSNKKSRM